MVFNVTFNNILDISWQSYLTFRNIKKNNFSTNQGA